jgi:hypothetical protein
MDRFSAITETLSTIGPQAPSEVETVKLDRIQRLQDMEEKSIVFSIHKGIFSNVKSPV